MVTKEYPYLYETHMHTGEGSKCGKNTCREMLDAAKAAGYTGVFLTEHNWGGNTRIDKKLPWEAWVAEFISGYFGAKEYADSVGLDMFWGYEAGGFKGAEFLIYGLEPQWLFMHPELREMSVKEHLALVRAEGGMVIHAHPFRTESYIPSIQLFPFDVDGVEGLNGGHRCLEGGTDVLPYQDTLAIHYANAYNLPLTAGSDDHSINLRGCGVAFRRKLTSARDYCAAIKADEDRILTDGVRVFDRLGRALETK